MLKPVLIVAFMLLAQLSLAQNLTFPRLIKLQQQEFNPTNNFFLENGWGVFETSGATNSDIYSVAWQKVLKSGGGRCKVSYQRVNVEGYREMMITRVVYMFNNLNHFTTLRREAETSGFKPDKPVIKDGLAFSTYTDGTTVILLGATTSDEGETIYVSSVMGYLDFYMHYLNIDKD